MRPFVESLARLYPNQINEEKFNELFATGKIDEEERQFILASVR